jgi:hypothetical protein
VEPGGQTKVAIEKRPGLFEVGDGQQFFTVGLTPARKEGIPRCARDDRLSRSG